MTQTISLVAGVSQNGVIGHDGALPWRLKEDLRRFARLTRGSSVIMGRKTFDSIIKQLGHPLTSRQNIVLSKNPDLHYEGAEVVRSLDEALETAKSEEVFVIGGEQVFNIALPRANKMYLTEVEADLEGDTKFPDFNESDWAVIAQEPHPADSENEYPVTFRTFKRKLVI